MQKIILLKVLVPCILFTSSLMASAEYTGSYVEHEDAENTTQNDTVSHYGHRGIGFFSRLGLVLSNGTFSAEYTDDYYGNGSFDLDIKSVGMDLAFGADFHKGKDKGFRLYGNVRTGPDTLYLVDDTTHDSWFIQIGAGAEGYIGTQNIRFIYGGMLSTGASDNMSYEEDSLSYFSIDPYIGAEAVTDGGSGGFIKVGYEWRSFDEQSGTYPGTNYDYGNNYISKYITYSIGIQKSF